jgi:hypothetical protein
MTGWSKGRKRATAASVVGVVAAIAVLLALPLSSLGSTSPLSKLTSDLSGALKGATTNVQSTVQKVVSTTTRSSTIARSSSAPRASSTSDYTPPQYGTNPHGQGTAASVTLAPSQTRPYTYTPPSTSNQDAIVVGRGRSEQQSDGSYDAHTTIAALFGNELLGVDANQGQSAQSPFQPLQSVLDQICTGSSGALCLSLLVADTSATSSGAATHFQTAGAKSNLANLGLNVNAASSDSAIQTSGSCQTASGTSQVAGVSLAAGNVASVANSGTKSTACTGQAASQQDNGSVIVLGNSPLGLPAADCANGTPNTLGLLPPLLTSICNADDQMQSGPPSGVREALTALLLNTGLNQAAARAATAASESHAVAPPATNTCTDSDKDCGNGETCVNGQDPDGDGDCTGNKCTDADHDCGIGANGQPETCVNGNDPDGDGDCTGGTGPSGQKKCTDSDKDCGAGEVCVNGADPDGDGDCHAAGTACGDSDHDCGIGPNGQREACVNGSDPDGDADCSSQVTALAAKTTLPFTGENVLLVTLVGLLLTGGGLALATRLRATSQKRR